MNYEIAIGVAATPAILGLAYYVRKSLCWRRSHLISQQELERTQQRFSEKVDLLERQKAELEAFSRFLEKRIEKLTHDLHEAREKAEGPGKERDQH